MAASTGYHLIGSTDDEKDFELSAQDVRDD